MPGERPIRLQCWACGHRFQGLPTEVVKPCPKCGLDWVNMEKPDNCRTIAAVRTINGRLVSGFVVQTSTR